jgi:DNA-binding transcriptional MerR regulator
VRRAQSVGFSLDEVRGILDDTVGGWNDMVAEKLAALRSQRGELDVMIAMLEEVRACGCRVVVECQRTVDSC